MNAIVRHLVDEMDKKTKDKGSRNTLVLLGDRDSRYLRGIEKRAHKLGLRCVWPDADMAAEVSGEPVCVLDDECKDEQIRTAAANALYTGYDIDRIADYGLSCCAEACLRLVKAYAPHGYTIAVTGRGHAQQGLVDALRKAGYGVVCLQSGMAGTSTEIAAQLASVTVHTSANMEPIEAGTKWQRVIDVVGNCKNATVTAAEVGALNISVLLHRFVGV